MTVVVDSSDDDSNDVMMTVMMTSMKKMRKMSRTEGALDKRKLAQSINSSAPCRSFLRRLQQQAKCS